MRGKARPVSADAGHTPQPAPGAAGATSPGLDVGQTRKVPEPDRGGLGPRGRRARGAVLRGDPGRGRSPEDAKAPRFRLDLEPSLKAKHKPQPDRRETSSAQAGSPSSGASTVPAGLPAALPAHPSSSPAPWPFPLGASSTASHGAAGVGRGRISATPWAPALGTGA